MKGIGIALDIGTSGLRMQAIDLDGGDALSTAVTARHPIPGANVIDHVNYAMDSGPEAATRLIINAVQRLMPMLKVDLGKVTTMAVCGNPFQLSLFQGIEVRDLAYAGKSMHKTLNITPPSRDGDVVRAGDIGLSLIPRAEVIIPPAVGHEIGADALAMLLLTGILEQDEPAIVIDYGTNAEMALVKDGKVFSGSAAAGPALEGQQIKDGMLAAPYAISDVSIEEGGWRCAVLDESFDPREGDLVDPADGSVIEQGAMHGRALGITGTGTIAAIDAGMRSGLVAMPNVQTADGRIHLQDGRSMSSKDMEEAGKAIGAIRAGYLTLMAEAGVWTDDVKLAYMCGASGLYVDAVKAQRIGLVPPGASRIVQHGNTSLALAKELVTGTRPLESLREMARKLRATHCMFATSEMFKDLYSIELSLWSYGMPFDQYNAMLDITHIKHIPMEPAAPEVTRTTTRDIADVGPGGVSVLQDPGTVLTMVAEGCTHCLKCVRNCPERAISISDGEPAVASIRSDLCNGTACRRCEMGCPEDAISLKGMRAQA